MILGKVINKYYTSTFSLSIRTADIKCFNVRMLYFSFHLEIKNQIHASAVPGQLAPSNTIETGKIRHWSTTSKDTWHHLQNYQWPWEYVPQPLPMSAGSSMTKVLWRCHTTFIYTSPVTAQLPQLTDTFTSRFVLESMNLRFTIWTISSKQVERTKQAV